MTVKVRIPENERENIKLHLFKQLLIKPPIFSSYNMIIIKFTHASKRAPLNWGVTFWYRKDLSS